MGVFKGGRRQNESGYNFKDPTFFIGTKMEEYRRTTESADRSDENKPTSDNEIIIGSNGTITLYVDVGLKALQEDKKPSIVIIGKGKTVNKAVSVVEIIKRRMEGRLYQYTQIGSTKTVDTWDPVKENNLDKISINKQLPVIIVRLSLTAIPALEATSGFQAPTGKDIYQ
ncbi:hypothetical protein J3Q64DRAFT_1693719 [Phycomyces blakesleeanus]|uniref:DNA/RNA-binding protein Alba-like domain-containing protein n=2 Tax=Phycomyces blakesleeanus TaxID=4837 RepID=A0A162TA75_PHYB8|nr:hypothetical protein PHYBLDRAFT_67295 [Phycomyces blakesleeanus NRRL 1555(-)]OAD67162.1 hypothetical protein PHYBLDRAFT_67295 [Phycomyces blakesleeanus NRRL 1555(-)]|eukprot:XP_018285202.1 hypothetical protein PHYBLDRAFT_67295 [Phycomyces blakesleeanus NRRL 1555(-)]